MSKVIAFFTRMVERLFETLERAAARDRERYVEEALNPRDLSQRIHRVESLSAAFHV